MTFVLEKMNLKCSVTILLINTHLEKVVQQNCSFAIPVIQILRKKSSKEGKCCTNHIASAASDLWYGQCTTSVHMDVWMQECGSVNAVQYYSV